MSHQMKFLVVMVFAVLFNLISVFDVWGQVAPVRSQAWSANYEPVDEATTHKVLARLFKTPLHFVPNQGQLDESVIYYATSEGAVVYCMEEGLTFRFTQGSIRLKFSENKKVIPFAQERLPGRANYFIGNNPARWLTDIPTFKEVAYPQVYPGIDLVYHGHHSRLKYTFYLQLGANPNQILMSYEGIESLSVDTTTGELIIQTPWGQMRDATPIAYQEIDGKKKGVDISFRIIDKKRVGFALGAYEPSYSLVLDPGYSTYLGGNETDKGYSIAVDNEGNAYVTGVTRSLNFPINPPQNPLQEREGFSTILSAFVTKLSQSGQLIYSTYLGGNSDEGHGIAVDNDGNAYVTGVTRSANFPTKNPYQDSLDGLEDAFVAKLSGSGTKLIYSTYLGGSGSDEGRSIAIDRAGNVYITGLTNSPNFPTQNSLQDRFGGGFFDAFVTKLSSRGDTLIYSTYLGGSGHELGEGITVDSADNAYVTGGTTSSDFPTREPYQGRNGGNYDVFATRFSASGLLIYSTYLGGSDHDYSNAIAVDNEGNVYVTGRTQSLNFPTQSPYQGSFVGGGFLGNDAFVTKLSTNGAKLIYSTYLGGSDDDEGYGIAVDSAGGAYVTGVTMSTNFPLKNPYQGSFGGGRQFAGDVFVAKLSVSGNALSYSTYLGGNENETGYGIAVDSGGNAYVTGETKSTNFPSQSPHQGSFGGGLFDVFIASFRIEETISPLVRRITITPSTATLTSGQTQQFNVQAFDDQSNSVEINNLSVTWALDGNIGIIDEKGFFTAQTLGNGKIQVTLKTNAQIAGETELITITPSLLVKLIISQPKTKFTAGETHQFTIEGFDAFDNPVIVQNTDVVWEVVGDIGNINENGFFQGTTVGSGTIIATFKLNDAITTQSTEITVTPALPADLSLTVTPDRLTAGSGATASVTITVTDAFGNPVTGETITLGETNGGLAVQPPNIGKVATEVGNGVYIATYTYLW